MNAWRRFSRRLRRTCEQTRFPSVLGLIVLRPSTWTGWEAALARQFAAHIARMPCRTWSFAAHSTFLRRCFLVRVRLDAFLRISQADPLACLVLSKVAYTLARRRLHGRVSSCFSSSCVQIECNFTELVAHGTIQLGCEMMLDRLHDGWHNQLPQLYSTRTRTHCAATLQAQQVAPRARMLSCMHETTYKREGGTPPAVS